ncbi:MAG: lysophospholipid acyltransferase family protein [Deltaproteobacteria bacterium]|nr:lysophospholipid acyltransferase family protein [Deltaproteobacteria bacterium]
MLYFERFLPSFLKRRLEIARINLDIAFPHLSFEAKERVLRDCILFFREALKEIILLKPYERRWLEKNVVINNYIHLKKLIEERPVVFLSGHFSNFEILPQLCVFFDSKFKFFSKPVKPLLLDSLVRILRQRNGAIFCDSFFQVLESEKTAFGFLFDQHSSRKNALKTVFFSRECCFNPVPIFFVEKFSYVPVFCYLTKTNNMYHFFWDAIDVDKSDFAWPNKLARALNVELEKIIARQPEQWFWFHRRWKGTVNYP